MTKNVVTFRKYERVGVLYDILHKCSHGGFPVVENHPLQPESKSFFCGYILRRYLHVLLDKKGELVNLNFGFTHPFFSFSKLFSC